jgi:acyl carrier protein
MDTPHGTEQRVITLLRERLHVDVPTTELNLFEAGALDSLRLVELLLYLERDLGVTVSFEDVELERFQSVARIAAFVAGRCHPVASDATQPLATAGGEQPLATVGGAPA